MNPEIIQRTDNNKNIDRNQRIFTQNELSFLKLMKVVPLSQEKYITRGFLGGDLKNYLASLPGQGNLNSLQREILIGALLGDGTLRKEENAKNVNFKYDLTLNTKEVVDIVYLVFKDLVGTPPKIQKRITRNSIWFRTYRLPELRHWYNIFYSLDGHGNNVRRVPLLLHRWITPLSLAIWFMDDGSKDATGGYYLHTQSFLLADITRLQRILGRMFHLEVNIHRDGSYSRLYIVRASVPRFNALVEPFILPCMRYKLHEFGRNPDLV